MSLAWNNNTPIRETSKLEQTSLSTTLKQLGNLYKLAHPNSPEIQRINLNKPDPTYAQVFQSFFNGKAPTNPKAQQLYQQIQQQAYINNDYVLMAMQTVPEEARDPYIEQWLRENLAQQQEQLTTLARQPQLPTLDTAAQPRTPITPVEQPNPQQPALPRREQTIPETPIPISPDTKQITETIRKFQNGTPFTSIQPLNPSITSFVYLQNENATVDIEQETKAPLIPSIEKLRDNPKLPKKHLIEATSIDSYLLTILPQRTNPNELQTLGNPDTEQYLRSFSITDMETIQTELKNTLSRAIPNPPDWLGFARSQRGKRPMLLAIYNDFQDRRQVTKQMQLAYQIAQQTRASIRLSETKFNTKPPVVWQVFQIAKGNTITYQLMPTYLYDDNGTPKYRPLFISEGKLKIYPYAIYISNAEQLARLVQLTTDRTGSQFLHPTRLGANPNNINTLLRKYTEWLNKNQAVLVPMYNAL